MTMKTLLLEQNEKKLLVTKLLGRASVLVSQKRMKEPYFYVTFAEEVACDLPEEDVDEILKRYTILFTKKNR
jgi:hypothetical protein